MLFTMETSAEVVATSTASEVLSLVFGSFWSADTMPRLRNWPGLSMCAVTVTFAVAPLASEAMVHCTFWFGFPLITAPVQPPPLIDWMVRPTGWSSTTTFVAVSGPLFVTAMLNVITSPCRYGPGVTNVFTTARSADGLVTSPAVLLLFDESGSKSLPLAVAVLLKAPAESIVAVTVMTRVFPMTMIGGPLIVQGNDEQLAPLTLWMVMFVGVSLTTTNDAGEGPALWTESV